MKYTNLFVQNNINEVLTRKLVTIRRYFSSASKSVQLLPACCIQRISPDGHNLHDSGGRYVEQNHGDLVLSTHNSAHERAFSSKKEKSLFLSWNVRAGGFAKRKLSNKRAPCVRD